MHHFPEGGVNVLITGGKGQVGRELARLCGEAGVAYFAPGREGLDVTDLSSLKQALSGGEMGRPVTAVIHTAAFTRVDQCESEVTHAYWVNAIASEALARLCGERDLPLVYLSTDFVFDGAKGAPYEVEDAAAPLSVYGTSKLAGEEAVRRHTERHYVVRTAWVYGEHGQNFPRAMLQAAASGNDGKPLRVVNDQTGAPTYARDLAEGVLALLGIEMPAEGIARAGPLAGPAPYGIYHLTNSGSCSWFEFACETLRRAGWESPVEPISSAELGRPAHRPPYSVLSLAGLTRIGLRPRPWQEALPTFLKRLFILEPGLFAVPPDGRQSVP